MIKLQNKQDLSKGPPVCVASNRGDPPWKYGVRGDPSFNSGSRGKPPELKNGYDRDFEQVLIFKDIDGNYCPNGRIMPGRIGKIGKGNKWRATAEEAVQYQRMGYNNRESGCVRLDYYPERSLNDFRNEKEGRGREGFHRALTMVATEMLCRATANEAVQYQRMGYNNRERRCVRLDYYPEESLNEFRSGEESRGRKGFHRALGMVAAEMLCQATANEAVQYQRKGYNNSERECVRLDYYPERSLNEFRSVGEGRGRKGFHRASTTVIGKLKMNNKS